MGQTTDVLDFSDSTAEVAPAGLGRLRKSGGVLQFSVDGGAWADIGAGGGGTGTVTSVAATVGGLLAIAGTPTVAPTVGLAAMATLTIIGNATAGPAVPTALTATQAKALLAIVAGDVSGLATIATSGSASDLGTGTLPIARIAAGAITLDKLATQATLTILGNNTVGSASPIALTAAQTKTLLAIVPGDVSGLAAIASSGSASDLSTGTLPAGRFPALTGDITTVAGALATTLKDTGPGAGSATYANLTIDAQGRVTAMSSGTAPITGTLSSGQVLFATGTGVASSEAAFAYNSTSDTLTVPIVTGLSAPTNGGDAANKTYVDNAWTDDTAGGNVTDLATSMTLAGDTDYEFEGMIVINGNSSTRWTFEPNSLATNQIAYGYGRINAGASTFGAADLLITSLSSASGDKIYFSGKIIQISGQHRVIVYNEDMRTGANREAYTVQGRWEVTTAITAFRIHCSVASGIGTGSILRMRKAR